MINNKNRVGNFTSSEIARLMANGKKPGEPGKPFYTYIQECNWERKLGKSIDSDSNARPLSWGKLCEKYVFQKILGTEYKMCAQDTIVHPIIDCWAGSPDGEKFDEGKTVTDQKCPMTLKSFCGLVEPLYQGLTGMDAMNAIRNGLVNENGYDTIAPHKDADTYFYQLVSNSILTKSKYAELIIFCPYQEELEEIREFASLIDDPIEQRKYYWVAQSQDDELPYLIKGGKYSNINIIRFEVPEYEKIALTTRVGMGNKLLIKRVF